MRSGYGQENAMKRFLRRGSVGLAAGLVGGLVFSAVGAEVVELSTKVSRVIVYAGWARVVRRGEAELAPGATRLAVRELPAWIDPGSLSAGVKGPGQARVVGVRARTVRRELVGKEDLARAEQAIVEVREQIADMEAELAARKGVGEYLDRLMPWRLEKIPEESTVRPVTAAEMKEVSDYLVQARLGNAGKTRELQRKQRSLQEELKEKEKERDKVAQEQGRTDAKTELLLDLTAEQPGKASVELGYLICGASWYPEHILRAPADAEIVTLSTQGVVRQATGEDWGKAAITLSALHPYSAQGRPAPGAWGLCRNGPGGAAPATPAQALCIEDAAPARLAAIQRQWCESTAQDEGLAAAAELVRANLARAAELLGQAASCGGAVELPVPVASGVKTDGMAVVLSDGEVELPFERRYRVVPAAAPTAFEVAVVRNDGPHPVLPGTVRVMRGARLAGREGLDFVARGARFEVDVGPSEAVKADRLVDFENSSVTQLGGRTRLTLAYRIHLKNTTKDEARVEVRDSVPATGGDVVRTTLQAAHPRAELGADGVLAWGVSLGPSKEMDLTYSLRLDYPSDRVPPVIRVLERQVAGGDL